MNEELDELEVMLRPEPEESAERAGLRYVGDEEPGYRRKRWGRGFTYLTPNGEHVKDEALRLRFEALAIPPAWTDVWICLTPRGHIQATGRDAEGRKQYVYHPRWAKVRNRTKFDRLLLFGRALPAIRARVDRDLRRHKLSREKVLAMVVALLEESLIRIGNPEYARRNRSYGLTTLQVQHLDISGSTLHFEFRGKSGKEQEFEVRDRRLARMVKRCQELPGQQLFRYVTDTHGCCGTVESGDVNDYLREITGQPFTAKDFRTWGGTVVAAAALHEMGPAESEAEAQANIQKAVERAAEALGNTPAVARRYYVHPTLLEAYEEGRLCEVHAEVTASENSQGLTVEEEVVVALLEHRLA